MKYLAQSEINDYHVLAPLPGTTKTDGTSDIQTYIPGLFTLIIGIAAVIAVGWIFFGGIQYMTTDSWNGKEEGKARIKNAVIGLIIVIMSWLILNTINPRLLTLDLNIESSTINTPAVSAGEREAGIGTAPQTACGNCVLMNFGANSALSINNNANKYINPDTFNKLETLNAKLKEAKLTGNISEGYNPTGHQNVCHANGTCIDLNLPVESPANIRTVIAATRGSNLSAIFEVESPERKETIVNDCGADATCRSNVSAHIMVLPPKNGKSQITGEHFSVYNCGIDTKSCATFGNLP